jgi:hypothetical protein
LSTCTTVEKANSPRLRSSLSDRCETRCGAIERTCQIWEEVARQRYGVTRAESSQVKSSQPTVKSTNELGGAKSSQGRAIERTASMGGVPSAAAKSTLSAPDGTRTRMPKLGVATTETPLASGGGSGVGAVAVWMARLLERRVRRRHVSRIGIKACVHSHGA